MEILKEGESYHQIPNGSSTKNQEYFQIVERQRKNFIYEILDRAMMPTRWEPELLTEEEQEEWWRIHQIQKELLGNTVNGLQSTAIRSRRPARKIRPGKFLFQ
ncbi:UNVERIFIED_CONTAM: hypothetical protein Sradi_5101400 [Sesamum radiatum]|uniref:Uncharacterized protein n=1 Tax=Sesamum radiatum TaxID=300843 RepID=A0AAW2M2H0_SESRA